MSILLETFGVTAFFIILGLVFVYIFACVVAGESERTSKYQKYESHYASEQHARSITKQKLLRQIGKPECPDGSFSLRQNLLWDQFNDLDRIDKILTKGERNRLVELQGYLPDEIADIIEGKR